MASLPQHAALAEPSKAGVLSSEIRDVLLECAEAAVCSLEIGVSPEPVCLRFRGREERCREGT